jgi:hypothetical protein
MLYTLGFSSTMVLFNRITATVSKDKGGRMDAASLVEAICKQSIAQVTRLVRRKLIYQRPHRPYRRSTYTPTALS